MKYCLRLVLLMLCASGGICSSARAMDILADTTVVVSDTVAVPDSLSFILQIDEVITSEILDYSISVLSMPLVFEKQETIPYDKLKDVDTTVVKGASEGICCMPQEAEWLVRANRQSKRLRSARNYVIVNRPDLVKYNSETLPKAPEEYVIINDPTKQTVTIVEKPIKTETNIEQKPVKVKHWIPAFTSAIQLSQVYVSENWYQGGTSSLNLLSDQLFTLNYNDPAGKLLFENLVQWKFNLTTSAEDTVHKVRVSEDLFQINSKFGYKAFGKWYYSASMLFKTQLLTNYAPNSDDIQTEFLSPGELNVGLGLSYSHSYDKAVKLSHTLTISPLSYNLRFSRALDPAKFGIEKGRARNEIGSSLDYTLTWDLRYNIRWMSHIYMFTDYEDMLVEWTNSFDFAFSNYFSARIYLDLRYDNSVAPDPRLGHLQIKELLSIGFSYKI